MLSLPGDAALELMECAVPRVQILGIMHVVILDMFCLFGLSLRKLMCIKWMSQAQ